MAVGDVLVVLVVQRDGQLHDHIDITKIDRSISAVGPDVEAMGSVRNRLPKVRIESLSDRPVPR